MDDIGEQALLDGLALVNTAEDAQAYRAVVQRVAPRVFRARQTLLSAAHRRVSASAKGETPIGLTGIERDTIAKELQPRTDRAEAFRSSTMFGLAPEAEGEHVILDVHGRPVTSLTGKQADALSADPTKADGWFAFALAANDGDAETGTTYAEKAIAASHAKILATEEPLFKSADDRLALYEQGALILGNPDATDAQRQLAGGLIAHALFPESFQLKQSIRLLYAMLPGTGNAVAAESSYLSAKSAIAAFEAGDYRKAATDTGLALLDAAGAIAGPVGAAAKTAATKSSKEFIKDSARRAARNVENRYNQIRFGRSEAARRYFQWTIRRTALKTSEPIKKAAEPALKALPTEQKQRQASVLESAVSQASEAFVDRKLRTWRVEVASEYQMGVLARAERAAAKAGDKEMQSAISSQITAEKQN